MGLTKEKEKVPIEFVTDSGKKILLVFEKAEYRAYDITGGGRTDMHLGSTIPDSLIKYIKKRW